MQLYAYASLLRTLSVHKHTANKRRSVRRRRDALTNSGRIIACTRNANFQSSISGKSPILRSYAAQPCITPDGRYPYVPGWFMTRLSRNHHVMCNVTISPRIARIVLSNITRSTMKNRIGRNLRPRLRQLNVDRVWNCARRVSKVDIGDEFVMWDYVRNGRVFDDRAYRDKLNAVKYAEKFTSDARAQKLFPLSPCVHF